VAVLAAVKELSGTIAFASAINFYAYQKCQLATAPPESLLASTVSNAIIGLKFASFSS